MQRQEIKIRLRRMVDDSYPIIIGKGVLAELAIRLKRNPLADRYALISDSVVARLYGGNLKRRLQDQGLKVDLFSFRAGERNKNQKVWQGLTERMLRLGLGRDSGVIALGGGVAGDLAGFVAATYLRGIPLIQVPTSLLAMVDASIGGKVAIDLPAGKNLLGAFWQPKAVYVDLACLRTLPGKHLLNGTAEVVKSGLIADPALFRLMESRGEKLLKRDGKILLETIQRSLRVKAGIVEQDERETLGLRKILNYGHTLGHALEALSGFQLLHGFAVALGMRCAGRISVEMGFLKKSDAQRQNRLLSRLGFPAQIPDRLAKKLKTRTGRKEFFGYLSKDKKVKAGRMEMVLLEGIGKVKEQKGSWTVPVEEELIALALEEIMR